MHKAKGLLPSRANALSALTTSPVGAGCAALIIIMVALGIVGHYDRQTELYEATQQICENSGGVSSSASGQACGKLIDEVQKDGKHEVLAKNGEAHSVFWVEEK